MFCSKRQFKKKKIQKIKTVLVPIQIQIGPKYRIRIQIQCTWIPNTDTHWTHNPDILSRNLVDKHFMYNYSSVINSCIIWYRYLPFES